MITVGEIAGKKVAFLPRHGSGHTIPPHKVNWRANIWALKELGCDRVLATCASGSLRMDYKPGDVVVVDQFIDWSKSVHTFYDESPFYHVSMADPFCSELRAHLIKAAKQISITAHEKGTYLRIEGPQLSTRAASRMYKTFADLIGMTVVPEAILCREKEMCFAIIATITDYDVWAEKPVRFDEVKKVASENIKHTKNIIMKTISSLPEERSCECKNALKGADA
jgi:5'-methylthioadenosine phosphorylase